MTDDKFQQLVQNHPNLFQKCGDIEFSVEDGWFTILDTLCGLITHRHDNALRRLKFALENPGSRMTEDFAVIEKSVQEEFDKLPKLTQVKEKFGSLRFYYDGGTDEVQNFVTFAESLTYHTCEVCGSPGEARNDGWVKVLCDKHYKEREEKYAAGRTYLKSSFDKTKLSDEI